MLKGALHVHSTYSDGEFTLAGLREVLTADGCAFACMTDHAEWLDDERAREYVRECYALSDERFLFIAGLEYECERRMHVLGFGVTSRPGSEDPQEVIAHIRDMGGVSAVAHPLESAFDWIEGFERLPDGIEAWNSKYDGRYAPRPATFRLVERLRRRRPDIRAFYGQDLHWRRQFRRLYQVLPSCALDQAQVLAALAAGEYFAIKGNLRLPPDGRLSAERFADFDRAHRRSNRIRRALKQAKTIGARFGVTVPGPLKAQLRRIF